MEIQSNGRKIKLKLNRCIWSRVRNIDCQMMFVKVAKIDIVSIYITNKERTITKIGNDPITMVGIGIVIIIITIGQ